MELKKPFWKNLLIIFFFLVLPFLFYHDTAAMNGILGDLDALLYHFPHRVYLWQQDNFSLWNPYRLCGFPELASMQAGMLYPPNCFFFTLFPPIAAFNLNVFFHFSLAGIFTYLYMRVLKIQTLPALFSGIAYMFCGILVNCSDSTNLQNITAWLPMMLFFMEKINQTRKFSYVVCAALVFAAIILIGHPPTAVSVGLILLYYIIYLTLRARTDRLTLLFYGGLIFVFGALLGMVQLLPTLELNSFTIRQEIRPDMIEITLQSYRLKYLITFFFPFFFGCLTDSFYPVDYYLKGFVYKGITYAGILPILFILAAWVLRKKADHRVWFWSIVIGFSFLLAMGNNTPLFLLFYRLPIFNLFYNSSAHMLELNFAVAVLSGIGLQYLLIENRQVRKKTVLLIMVFLLVFAAVAVALLINFASSGEIASHYRVNLSKTLTFFNPAIYIPFIMMLLSGTVCWFIYQYPKNSLCRIILLAVLFIDLYSFGHFVQTNSFKVDDAGFGKEEPSVVRFLKKAEKDFNSYRIFPVVSYLATIKTFDFIMSDLNILYPVSSITAIDSLYYANHARLLNAKRNGTFNDPIELARNSTIISLLNVKYLVTIPQFADRLSAVLASSNGERDESIPFFWGQKKAEERQKKLVPLYEKVFTSDTGVSVFQNRNALPRVYMVGQVRAVADFDAAFNILWSKQEQFDPSRQALVELPGEVRPGPLTAGKADLVSYNNDEVLVETRSEGKSFLVLGDTFYPGWKAYVDGREAEIFRTNGIVRGVFVSPGHHTVSFRYLPFSFVSGAFISGLVLIILIIILIFMKNKIVSRKV